MMQIFCKYHSRPAPESEQIIKEGGVSNRLGLAGHTKEEFEDEAGLRVQDVLRGTDGSSVPWTRVRAFLRSAALPGGSESAQA